MSKSNIAEFYPLSPMQQGILFHTLYQPKSSVYFGQLLCTLHGKINVSAFKQSWQKVIERHFILRTSFVWEGLKEPVQVVRKQVSLPWEQLDWRALSTIEQQAHLETFLKTDRERNFELTSAPLIRLKLILLEDNTYQFIWSHHHLILDGWSIPLILKEVFEFYDAFCEGQELKLTRPRPYRDYIAWLHRQDLSAAESFWRDTLKGFTAPTPLVVDQNLSLSHTENEQGERKISLSPSITAALQSLARQHQLTLNTLVQGAWALLLSRYSGEEDVVFGATVSGRPPDLLGAESIVGMFINTLPMRVSVPAEASILSWLKQLQFQQVELREYEYSPLVEIQRQWSQLPHNIPLFESIVVFENYPVDPALHERISHLEICDVRSHDSTNYPITVTVLAQSELTLKILYDCRRFDADTITRMLGHFQTLLEGIVANPVQRISELPLLTSAERQQILIEWNNTQTDYPHDKCVHQLFEAQVERTPDAVAAVFQDKQLTYRQLNAKANQLAHYLRSLGVKPDGLVGICALRSLDMMVGILAILKAGGAYVPLDPTYPSERLAFMLEDAQVPVLLTQERLLETLPKSSAQIVCLDNWDNLNIQGKDLISTQVNSSNLAYVIYTSGSTGTPKGVAIEHKSTVSLLNWAKSVFTPEELTGVLASTSICFDLSVFEIFVPLCWGGTVILAENALHLPTLKAANKVTLINTVPSAISELLRSDSIPTSVRTINLAGEALKNALVQQLYQRPHLQKVYNLYGPSEDTTYSTFALIERNSEGIPPIGRPISKTQVYVLDKHLQPVPVGVPGEVYIGGEGLARGYYNRPDLTAEKFIANPFSKEPNSRLYKTGDLARYLPDGTIEYLSRIDNQVKIRGFRIELGEIEAALSQHPSVEEAVVIAREDEPGNQRLVAYVVADEAYMDGQVSGIKSSELRSFLKEKLPEYMVPAVFLLLEALPLTPNGKVDRRALPAPQLTASDLKENFAAPRTPIEEVVAQTYALVLGVEKVDIYDNFFELGGHSLLATQVISRLREAFQIAIPLVWLFELPAGASLSERIEAALKSEQKFAAPPIHPVPRNQTLPLSFAQQRMWFLQQLAPDSSLYNSPVAVRLKGSLNLAALEQSFNEIIQRHEALRTSFVEMKGELAQIIHSTVKITLPVIDLSEVPTSNRDAEVRRLAAEDAGKPFDLTQCPLLRTTLLRLNSQEHIALLTMHHIVSDGWSMGVFLKELAALYEAFCAGNPSPLPELPVQYADFAVWQRQWLQGEVLQSELNYWRQQLSSRCPQLKFSTKGLQSSILSNRGAKQSFIISKDVSEALAQLSRQEGVTLFMTLLAAFQALLYCHTGAKDIRIGSPIANRNPVETEKLIGFFINTLVLRNDLSENATFREIMRRCRTVALGAYAHQDLPFEKLVEELQPERNLNHNPMYQAWFVLQNAPMPPLELAGLTLSLFELETETARHDLLLDIWEIPEGLNATFEYKTELFDKTLITRLIRDFEGLLRQVVAQPNSRLSELAEIIAETGRQEQLLQEKELQATGRQKLKMSRRKAIQDL